MSNASPNSALIPSPRDCTCLLICGVKFIQDLTCTGRTLAHIGDRGAEPIDLDTKLVNFVAGSMGYVLHMVLSAYGGPLPGPPMFHLGFGNGLPMIA
jgi:hypothetical protein